MSDIAIKIEDLGKRYKYGAVASKNDTLRADLADWAKGLIRRRESSVQSPGTTPSTLSPQPSTATTPSTLNPRHSTFREVHEKHIAEDPNYFWALKDINLEVRQGEVVGFVGRNGAGKSTLLKVLSRITPPTTGKVTFNGRIASLLEVGTGFHRELTGRENILLNGSILGMKRSEITRKFDEIVAFAEVEKFIDTPVKFYSSGMYVRLAFAVAAHLEPEILVVDEVLAVGDASFQKKCLGKMGDVAKQGRTILFVSHNMAAVQSLCARAIWLDAGQIKTDGPAESTILQYVQALDQPGQGGTVVTSHAKDFEVERVRVKDCSGQIANLFLPGDSITIEIDFMAARRMKPYLCVSISGHTGPLFSANMVLDGKRTELTSGRGTVRCHFKTIPLSPQQVYFVRLSGREGDGRSALFEPQEVAHFRVIGEARDVGFDSEAADNVIASATSILVPYTWEFPDGTQATVTPIRSADELDRRANG